MDAHGLANIPIQWDKAKNRMGGCCHMGDQVLYLTFSSVLMPLLADSEVLDTIRHEIAHAKCPLGKHGAEWQAAAIAIGAAPFPCKAVEIDNKLVGYKYIAPCACGPTVHVSSRRRTRSVRCAKCQQHLTFIQQY